MARLPAHPVCRPARDAVGARHKLRSGLVLWRLGLDGRWRPDNGDPGLAFIGRRLQLKGESEFVVWVAHCACKLPIHCPVTKALEHARERLDIDAISIHRRPAARKQKR